MSNSGCSMCGIKPCLKFKHRLAQMVSAILTWVRIVMVQAVAMEIDR